MATFTKPDPDELRTFLAANGFDKCDEFQGVEGGSVNSNFSFTFGGSRWFLRIYEEQDESGAAAERAMLAMLLSAGVPTPVAKAHGRLAGKPAAVFPWVEGAMSCQRGVTPSRARAVGAALARVHLAPGASISLSAGRFHADALRARLAQIPNDFPRVRIRTSLEELAAARDGAVATGLVHGDLFRDNVLWRGDEIAALLDFESAFRGPLVFDLAVTLLAWCYADAFEPELARAMVAGYEAMRPLAAEEKRAFYTEARFAAVRFTITRITDYAMRGGENRVMKDWRRFLARLDALDAMGESGFVGLVT